MTAPLPQIENTKVIIDDKLTVGGGNYGKIYLGQALEYDGNLSESIIAKMSAGGETANHYLNIEEYMNAKLQKSCPMLIAPYIGSTTFHSEKLLVWKFSGKSNLEEYLISKKKAELGDALGIALNPNVNSKEVSIEVLRQLLQCLAGIHAQGVVHRDIKPSNILIDEAAQRIRLIDFGSAAEMKATIKFGYDWKKSPCDPVYCPPEKFLDEHHPYKFDVYSAGIIFLRMVFPHLSASPANLQQFLSQLEADDYDINLWLDRKLKGTLLEAEVEEGLNFLGQSGGRWWLLLTQMIKKAPGARLTAEAALAIVEASPETFDKSLLENKDFSNPFQLMNTCAIVDDIPATIVVALSKPMGLVLEENEPGKSAGVYVLDIAKESPAAKGGLQVGDKLIMVQDKDTRQCSFETVMDLISSSPRGQKVRLTFERPSASQIALLSPATSESGEDPRLHQFSDPVDMGACSLQGKRSKQEDSVVLRAFCITPPEKPPICLYIAAVFDGHCGPEASAAAARVLPAVLKGVLEENYALRGISLARLVWDRLKLHPEIVSVKEAGSTANIVLIMDDGVSCFLNCGDSRAILTSFDQTTHQPRVVFATKDHCTSNEEEIQRIQTEGGKVDCVLGKNRVVCDDWKLTVARNIGAPKWRKYAVSNQAEITLQTITDTNKVIVVASDGVWSELGTSAVCLKIHQWRESGLDASAASQRLCSESLESGSIDNISAVVIYF